MIGDTVKFKEVLKDELHNLTKGKYPLIVIIFLLPLLFTFLFGIVYHANVVQNIPMVIYDQDQSNLSRALIQTYNDSERFQLISYVNSQEEMEYKISTGEALVGVGIPQDFSKNTKRGVTSNIILVVDSANNMFGNAALSAAQEINRTFSVGIGQRLIEAAGVLPDNAMNMVYPLRFSIRILNNPTNSYTPFMLSGLMMNGLQIGLMLIIGPLIVVEFKRKKYDKSYASSVLVAAKCIPCWLAAMLAYGLSIICMNIFFEVPVKAPIIDLIILGGAFLYFVITALAVLGAFSPNIVMSLQVPLLYIMPGLLYSGLSWPDFAMNDIAYFLSHILPMTYAADNLRDLLLSGYAPRLMIDSLYMFFLGTFCLLLAIGVMSFRRTHDPLKMVHKYLGRLSKKEAV